VKIFEFGQSLLVDTGDEKMNKQLSGYMKVIAVYSDTVIHLKLKCNINN